MKVQVTKGQDENAVGRDMLSHSQRQRSSLLSILNHIPSLILHTHVFYPLTHFLRPLLSTLCGLVIFLSAVICSVLDRHTELLFRCLAVNTYRVPDGRQNSCRILCFIILFSSEGRGYHWNKEGMDEAFPPRPLSTQISGCIHFPGILLLVIHQSHHTQPWGPSTAIQPAWPTWLLE